MVASWHTQDPVGSRGIPLDEGVKELRRQYYAGSRLESPMGGFLEPLRVRVENDGSGTALFECSASSLRFELRLPRATTTERKKVRDAQEDGLEPDCPRHPAGTRLQRVGSYLVCPRCGVRFGRPV
jgi:hypothetical protein